MGGPSGNPFLVTCEHATNRLPKRYGTLGLDPERLAEHIAWDPGAREIARALARRLGCPIHEGRYSRLLIDLNRNLNHPKLIAQRSFGVEIPGNQNLRPSERRRRVVDYWTPFREKVLADISAIAGEAGRCVHLGVHSFTPAVDGVEREVCIAILYDPSRQLEAAIAGDMAASVRSQDLPVRRNYPYRGTSDGLTTACRRLFADEAYAGIEIEVSQKLLQTGPGTRRIATAVIAAAFAAWAAAGPATPSM